MNRRQVEPSLPAKALCAGTAACMADMATFPLDTAKVRLQLQGEGKSATKRGLASKPEPLKYRGMIGTMSTMVRQEGVRSLYNGLSAGLQRQMSFASIRIGLYDHVKGVYQGLLVQGTPNASQTFLIRVSAGLTTGGLAVMIAQPTDVVKVRMQAQVAGAQARYAGCFDAYKTIAREEGAGGLWKGLGPNVARNSIVNVAEIVCYDIIKSAIISHNLMSDSVPCHFTSAVAAGFCTTVIASPVDVVKTRVMNSSPGQYRGAVDCAVKMFREGGFTAFYKGFIPNFSRFVSWNICMWLTYEQLKRVATYGTIAARPAYASG